MELLLPHVLYLRERGYSVETSVSGVDGLGMARGGRYDMVFLDEEMPGMGGLETLGELRKLSGVGSVVLVTRNEGEGVMEAAIGGGVSDYLIKPVSREQLLVTVKKHIHGAELRGGSIERGYGAWYGACRGKVRELGVEGWEELYKGLVEWGLQLEGIGGGMVEVLRGQWQEAEEEFGRYVRGQYAGWIKGAGGSPLLSPGVYGEKIAPLLEGGVKVWWVVIDNLRWDQWRELRSQLPVSMPVEEGMYWSILPTTTQYSRNALFSGLLPLEVKRRYPGLWKEEGEEGSKNASEAVYLEDQMKRLGGVYGLSYRKGVGLEGLKGGKERNLNVVVLNFVDMLSHAGMDSLVVRELSRGEAGYREVVGSWLRHSGLGELLERVVGSGGKVVLTTDHGTVRVERSVRIQGSRELNANVRYKSGKHLTYDSGSVYEVLEPEEVGLPGVGVGSRYVFAVGQDFFVYPNGYHEHVRRYKETYQHGGVSMEEMLVPLAVIG